MGTIQSSINQGIATSLFLANQAGAFDARKATKNIKNAEAVNDELGKALNARSEELEKEGTPESVKSIADLNAIYDTRAGEYENSLREAAILSPKKFTQKYVDKTLSMAETRRALAEDLEQYADHVGDEYARMTSTPLSEQEMAALEAQQRVEQQKAFKRNQTAMWNVIKEQSKGGSM